MNGLKQYFVLGFLLLGTALFAQEPESKQKLVMARIIVFEGDSMPMIGMPVVTVVASGRKSKAFQKNYARLKKKIVKVYPYATIAGRLLDQYEKDLAMIGDKKDKKKYIDKAEKKLKKEFEGVLKDLTMSEGRILIKLIDRETHRTSYQLVDELKGGAAAFMWQGVARLFGSNLKTQYDPLDRDFVMERIVRKIESGEISLTAQN